VKSLILKTILLAVALSAGARLTAGDKDKKDTPAEKKDSRIVDSGSFGIYVDGKRIGTETFRIEQMPEYSVATAEIKVDDGQAKSVQTSEMQIKPNGDLRSYSWRSTLPQKEENTVEPNDQLLTEHIMPADQKKIDLPHILPASTIILDDNFFSQREILVWRYLATGCKAPQILLETPANGGLVRNNNMVTGRTRVAHRYAAGDRVQVSGSLDSSFSGVFQIVSVPDNLHVTYAQAGPNAASGNGEVSRPGEGLVCAPGNFGFLIPRQHSAGNATIELLGQDRIMLKGAMVELNKVTVKTGGPQGLAMMSGQKEMDNVQWLLWVDDQYKVVKMAVPGSNVEAIRD
jgi:hypothetical protein